MKKFIALICFAALHFTGAYAAADAGELIRGNAKFNAVIIILTVIFAGLVFFLFRLDRRLRKLESQKGENS